MLAFTTTLRAERRRLFVGVVAADMVRETKCESNTDEACERAKRAGAEIHGLESKWIRIRIEDRERSK